MVFQALYEDIKPAQRDASSNFSTYLNSSPAWAWPGAWPRRRYIGRQKSHLLSVPPFLGRGERSRRRHSPLLDAGTPSLGISSFIYSLAGWFRPRAHPNPCIFATPSGRHASSTPSPLTPFLFCSLSSSLFSPLPRAEQVLQTPRGAKTLRASYLTPVLCHVLLDPPH